MTYLFLNVIVIAVGCYEIFTHPDSFRQIGKMRFLQLPRTALPKPRTIFGIIAMSLLVFPKLALGLSGFETGVAVMPLVQRPNRIGNTRKLLMSAALIMSVMLIASSFVTSVIIPASRI